jgi:hypothetical protein
VRCGASSSGACALSGVHSSAFPSCDSPLLDRPASLVYASHSHLPVTARGDVLIFVDSVCSPGEDERQRRPCPSKRKTRGQLLSEILPSTPIISEFSFVSAFSTAIALKQVPFFQTGIT